MFLCITPHSIVILLYAQQTVTDNESILMFFSPTLSFIRTTLSNQILPIGPTGQQECRTSGPTGEAGPLGNTGPVGQVGQLDLWLLVVVHKDLGQQVFLERRQY